MKNLFPIIVVWLFCAGCRQQPTAGQKTASEKANVKKDTAIFELYKQTTNIPVNFNDNNEIVFGNGVKIAAKESGEDNYRLEINHSGKLIFEKDSLQGVSKVLLSDDSLFFSIFTFSDEDGRNEGYAYIVNLKDNSAIHYPSVLKNTCNPIRYGEGYIFLSDGELIQTSSDLMFTNRIDLIDNRKHAAIKLNLDEYSIDGLSNSLLSGDHFQMLFNPDRLSAKSKFYDGKITSNTGAILLTDVKSKR